MDRRRFLIWALGGCIGAAAYVYMTFNSGKDAAPIMIEKYKQAIASGPEARDWLERNKHPFAFASNRFESTEDALRFVTQLYSSGAGKVVVSPDLIRAEPENGGDYSDALVVKLPEDAAERQKVIAIGQVEAARDGMVLGDEVEHGFMFLWWD